MQFFTYVAEYIGIMFKWVTYKFQVLDFQFSVFQIFLFMFIFGVIWAFLGWYARGELSEEFRYMRNKRYDIKRGENPDFWLHHSGTFRDKEIERLKKKYD